MRRTLCVLVWAAVLGLPLAARANPGDLDPSFGTGGQVVTAMSSGFDAANALVLQPDGKVVAAGHAYNAANAILALARYNTDGSLDASFGTGGKVTTPIGTASGGTALVLQPDGKLVAAGYTTTGTTTAFALVRYNTNGTLDTSFGAGGKVTTSIGSIDDEVYALVLQPDGKLVAAGYSDKGSNIAFALARYNANGSLDTSFGTAGKVTTAIGSSDDEAYALVLQPDGKVVAAGYTYGTSSIAIALARYSTNGSLDTTFGTGGKVTTAIGSVDDEVFALVLQPDGKLVAAGLTDTGVSTAVALVRYGVNGSLDTSFGTGGKVTTSIGGIDDEAFALALQSDGKIVAAGYANDGGSQDLALLRYTSQGSLDVSFGTGGHVVTQTPSTYSEVNALLLQPDAKLVAAGYSYNGTDTDFTLARYLGQVCGDGVVQAPEPCDDGAANGTVNSCCTTTCQFRASGTACDDGHACTYDDTCDGSGVCVGTGITCTSDQCTVRACNGTSSCTATPLSGCSTTTTTSSTTSTTSTQPSTTTTSTTSSTTSTTATTSTSTTSTSTQPDASTTTSTTSPTTSTTATTSTSTTSTQPDPTTTSTTSPTTTTTSTTSTQPDPSTTSTTSSTTTTTSTTSTTSTQPDPTTTSTTTTPTTTTTSTTTSTSTTSTEPTATSTTSTTATTEPSSTTSTTTPCPDTGFGGVGCLLRSAIPPPDCADQKMPQPVQRRVMQAASLIDRAAGTSNGKKARAFLRKASKTLKKAVALAATATGKRELSARCGDALDRALQEAERRAEQLAADL